MWFRTHRAMKRRKRRTDDVSGEHRAVIELAATMQYELDIQDIDPSLLREETLKERVDKELRGGAISYAYAKIEVQADSSSKGRGSIKAWFRREKWWFSAIVFTSLLCSTIWMSSMYSAYGEPQGAMWFWAWCFGVWFGQFWAFCIGTTTGSRMLIILFWSAVAAIVVIILRYNS
ncbi:hypothetical protein BKA66DRAFT_475845 [Pyrenochaeta sp. MPI-SDFR-AT-0127]|nr:hypothetical protein BKA66DRAFT_475845 [Pyrenochaeta sp. MPI-SDFR-AT-0127]